ncbi:MAG: isoprenylcysteine carboxylmethyltransferase family protein [Actinomycetia bacterium]|nr:isoprenylcysteine carboxylmethyltransferase family protein [Actinomycetes bacterium]
MSPEDSDMKSERGIGWVLAQGALFVFFFIAVLFGDSVSEVPGLVLVWTVGVIIAVGGAALSAWSVLLHGSRLSPFPFPVEGMQVIDTGPYRYMRHPMYSGIVLFTLGVGLAYGKPSVLLSSLTFLVFFVAKSGHEEDMMIKYMDGYREYRSSVPWRIIPFVV